MSESLRSDARIWTPRRGDDERPANDIPGDERGYSLEHRYPTFDNLVPHDVASRANSQQINTSYGVGPLKNPVYLDLRDAIGHLDQPVIRGHYLNLIQMYEEAIDGGPYKVPMRITPTCHFTTGGLWSGFSQMTSAPGLLTDGEALWTYHGASRLSANSLLSGPVDGWFALPFTIPNCLDPLLGTGRLTGDAPEAKEALDHAQARLDKLMNIRGKHGAEYFHRQLDEILYRDCGAARNKEDLTRGIKEIRELRKALWSDLLIPGEPNGMNQQLEYANRVADYIDLGGLMCVDTLDRDESCGAHCHDNHISEDGEAERNDASWCFVSTWRRDDNGPTWDQSGREFIRHAEPLTFGAAPLVTRSYE